MPWSATPDPLDPSKIAAYRGHGPFGGATIWRRPDRLWVLVDSRRPSRLVISQGHADWSSCVPLAAAMLLEPPLEDLL